MPKLPVRCAITALLAVALGACARQPVHEEQPHHFSKDSRGYRTACYVTDIANEYECVPVARRYARGYDPYYDPFWPHGYLGWYPYGYPYGHTVYAPYPVASPSPPPPKRWHRPR